MILTAVSLFLSPAVADAYSDTLDIGTAETFGVLGGTGVTNSLGATVVTQDLGVGPTMPVTGFPPGIVTGNIHLGDDIAVDALADLNVAITDASTRPATDVLAGAPGGLTLVSGVHHSVAAVGITGVLTLDGEGDPNSVFILRTDGALNTAAASSIVLINGAQACNVFWQVDGATTLGGSSTFVGSVLTASAITVGALTGVDGRLLSLAGFVTLDTDTITAPECAVVPPTTTSTTLATTTTSTTLATTTTSTSLATTTTTTLAPTTTSTTLGDSTTSTTLVDATTTSLALGNTSTTTNLSPVTTVSPTTDSTISGISVTAPTLAEPGLTAAALARSGANTTSSIIVAGIALLAGFVMVWAGRRVDASKSR